MVTTDAGCSATRGAYEFGLAPCPIRPQCPQDAGCADRDRYEGDR